MNYLYSQMSPESQYFHEDMWSVCFHGISTQTSLACCKDSFSPSWVQMKWGASVFALWDYLEKNLERWDRCCPLLLPGLFVYTNEPGASSMLALRASAFRLQNEGLKRRAKWPCSHMQWLALCTCKKRDGGGERWRERERERETELLREWGRLNCTEVEWRGLERKGRRKKERGGR